MEGNRNSKYNNRENGMKSKKKKKKITIKDIVEQCGLTRKTFYYYFRDIYDLMDAIADQELEKLLEESMAAPTPEEALKCFFRYLLPRQGHLERIMESREHMMLARVMFDKVYRYFSRLIEEKGKPLNMKKDEMDLAMHFFIYGILGILMERKFQTEEDIDKIVDQLIRLIKGRRTAFPELFSE